MEPSLTFTPSHSSAPSVHRRLLGHSRVWASGCGCRAVLARCASPSNRANAIARHWSRYCGQSSRAAGGLRARRPFSNISQSACFLEIAHHARPLVRPAYRTANGLHPAHRIVFHRAGATRLFAGFRANHERRWLQTHRWAGRPAFGGLEGEYPPKEASKPNVAQARARGLSAIWFLAATLRSPPPCLGIGWAPF